MIRRKNRQALLRTRSAFVLCSICWSVTAYTAEEDHHKHEQNEIAVFIGLSHERRENGAALGLEYERRIDESLGIGVLAERTWGDFDIWVFAVPLTLHVNRWKLVLAPGVEESGGRTEQLVRVTVGYEFETSKTKVTPSLSVDFVDGDGRSWVSNAHVVHFHSVHLV